MNRYEITYGSGSSEQIDADSCAVDHDDLVFIHRDARIHRARILDVASVKAVALDLEDAALSL
jgi:hypothetical protein